MDTDKSHTLVERAYITQTYNHTRVHTHTHFLTGESDTVGLGMKEFTNIFLKSVYVKRRLPIGGLNNIELIIHDQHFSTEIRAEG